jgi:hypothetical protein
MTTTRLKMVVNTVTRTIGASNEVAAEELTLSPVYSDKEGSANKAWSKATPCGQLKFTVTNPNVFNKILPGQWYYIDLIPTDKDSL